MRVAKVDPTRRCPICDSAEKQVNAGKNATGTQRCFCNICKKYYTQNPKTREYPEEVRKQAVKIYYSGVSARGVGKILGMNKSNVLNWIKKTNQTSTDG